MGRKPKEFAVISHKITLSNEFSPISKAVYLVLRSFNPSYVSYTKIMSLTGIGSRTSISRAIKQLTQLGAIKAVRDYQRRSRLYRFPHESVLHEYRLVHKMDSSKSQELVKISQKTNTKEIEIQISNVQQSDSKKMDVKKKITIKKDQ